MQSVKAELWLDGKRGAGTVFTKSVSVQITHLGKVGRRWVVRAMFPGQPGPYDFSLSTGWCLEKGTLSWRIRREDLELLQALAGITVRVQQKTQRKPAKRARGVVDDEKQLGLFG